MTVLTDHAGTIWTGSNCGGLSRLDGGHFTTYAEAEGLTNSCVWTLAEDDHHDLWIGTWGGGVFRFHDGHFTNYSTPQGLPSSVALSIAAARDGSIWIATLAGVSHIQNGHFRNYTTADGLSSDRILTVYQDHRGEIWVGTDNGIDHLVGDRFVLVQSERHSDHVPYSSLREDALGDLYVLSSVDGINRIANDHLVNIWRGIQPLGMLESTQHTFWFSGNRGVFRIAASELQRAEHDRDSPLDYAEFGRPDGLNTPECSEGQPNMATTPDDKLWVATTKGLAMIDLKGLFRGRRTPNIFVGTISIDGKSRFASPTLSLQPGVHHLELHFDVIDLSSPEKVRLQYRMDGVDSNWLDADSTRTAIYTNIPTGSHLFHIRATDSSGVWDRTGVTYLVAQQPFFYQTTWFLLLIVMSIGLLLVSIYLLRVRYLVGQVRGRLEERMSERERIARELHDTLLQGFQGLILRFHAITLQMPASGGTRKILETALERADEVLAEGRDRVNDLRVTPDPSIDLSQALAQVARELSQEHSVDFNVAVEGEREPLHPIVRDEAFRVGREALINAFRHAQAKRIEIEVAYSRHEIRLRLRDDGSGIDKDILEAEGKRGHWGIRGMRERAQKIGAQLTIWSRPGAGTEVELRVPASVAYRKNIDGALWQRLVRAAGWRVN
jgi:signal transduction histidine kinase